MSYIPSIAAAAALLFVSACATGGGQAQQDVASLRAELRTLQRENAELVRRVDSMATQIDVLAARAARSPAAPPTERQAEVSATPRSPPTVAPSTPAGSASTSTLTEVAASLTGEEPVVIPSHLKVVRLASPSRDRAPPPVPVTTPIQEPSAATLASLGASKPASGDADGALDRARGQSGLARARAMEQFVDAYPSSARAGEALVDAARGRLELGDPDGSCEDFSRAVAEYPASRATPDALEGLAACESRRGRAAEATRLQNRLVKEFPDSPAGKRAREHVPSVQGAAP